MLNCTLATLTLNPFIGIQIAVFTETLLILSLLFSLNKQTWLKQPQQPIHWVLCFFMEIFKGIYYIFGILFIDIAISWLVGSWGYSDWRFQLPSVIIIFIVGVQYIILTAFKKISLLKIMILSANVLILTLFLHWWVPLEPILAPRLEENIVWVLIIMVILYLIENLVEMAKKMNLKISQQNSNTILLKIINILEMNRYNLIFWILSVTQAFLTLNGYSLFNKII